MTITIAKSGIVSGIWKFVDSVGVEILLERAAKWKSEEPERYAQLYVRRCSRDQLGIVFMYKYDNEESYKKFFYMMTDKLKRKFGNDFVGHDVTSDVWFLPENDNPKQRIDLDEVQPLAENLVKLLKDRNCGLSIWNDLFLENLQELHKITSKVCK